MSDARQPEFGLDLGHRQQGKSRAVRVLERQNGFPEAFDGRLMRNAPLDKTVHPEADSALWNAENGLLRLPNSDPARSRMFPRKERQDCAGASRLVSVIEMIGAGIVEIDRLLDKAKT